MPFTKLISVVEVIDETVLLAGRDVSWILWISLKMFEVYFSAEKQVTCDNKRWFKNDFGGLTYYFHDNLKCPFVCDLYYMIHLILYIWFTLFHVVLYI